MIERAVKAKQGLKRLHDNLDSARLVLSQCGEEDVETALKDTYATQLALEMYEANLIDALAWYSNQEHYYEPKSPIVEDKGARARLTLASLASIT